MCNERVRLGLILVVVCEVAAQTPQFLTADIHATTNIRETRGRSLPNGDIAVLNTTLKDLVTVAYEAQEGTVVGASGWMASEHYDLIAKAPPGTSMDTVRLMLRPLLAERFRLAVHVEPRMTTVLALVVAHPSAALRKSSTPGAPVCTVLSGAVGRQCSNLTMAELARQLAIWPGTKASLPIVDRTGLDGGYDFQVIEGPAKLDPLGLKLEQRRQPIPVVVIDHAEPIRAGK
jgi:uncharacterized protein (TIGR03435 family)